MSRAAILLAATIICTSLDCGRCLVEHFEYLGTSPASVTVSKPRTKHSSGSSVVHKTGSTTSGKTTSESSSASKSSSSHSSKSRRIAEVKHRQKIRENSKKKNSKSVALESAGAAAAAADATRDADATTSTSSTAGGSAADTVAAAAATTGVPNRRTALLESVKPLQWVHVPKAGSAFLNVIAGLPGVCNLTALPATALVDFFEFAVLNSRKSSSKIPKYCTGFAKPGMPLVMHFGVGGADWDTTSKGHAMIMLRKPEQRIISAYYYSAEESPSGTTPNFQYLGYQNDDIATYAKKMQGCAVRMLTREGTTTPQGINTFPCQGEQATTDETGLAISRLHDFAFVGLTEKWDLSVCLIHAMFGGPCLASDFVRLHKGKYHVKDHSYDSDQLGDFSDPHDGALYREAEKIFEQNLQKYGVSEKRCRACFQVKPGDDDETIMLERAKMLSLD